MRSYLFLSAFAALLLSAACSQTVQKGVALDRELKPYVSSDAKALVYLDVAHVQQTPFWRSHQDRLDLERLNSWTSEFGLDPRKDVSDILLIWDARQPLLVIRGRYDLTAIRKRMSSLKMPGRVAPKAEVYTNGRAALALVSPTLALAGTEEKVMSALSNQQQGAVPEELAHEMEALSSGDQLWVVSRDGLPFGQVPLRSDYQSLLSNIAGHIRNTRLGIAVQSGLKLSGEILCDSEQGARRVHDALRGFIGFGRLSTPDNQPQLLRAYDALKVEQSNQAVRIDADLPKDLADQLIALLPQGK